MTWNERLERKAHWWEWILWPVLASALAGTLMTACDQNECGSVKISGSFLTGPTEIYVDCPGDQDIRPGNTFDAEATLPGFGMTAIPKVPRPPQSRLEVPSAPSHDAWGYRVYEGDELAEQNDP